MSEYPDFTSIEDALRTTSSPLTLTLHSSVAEDEFTRALRDVADALARIPGAATLLRAEEAKVAPPATPALTLQRSGKGVVHYLALPAGPEETPFLAWLRDPDETPELPDEVRAALASLSAPAVLLVFIAEACPHCPRAVGAALQLAAASPAVTVAVVDAQRFPVLAERYRVQSAPATVLDDGLVHVGVRPAHEVAADVLARGEAAFAERVFRSLVETGRFEEAAGRIVAGDAAAHLLAAWRESTTSSRIGLLLTAEKVLEGGDAPLHPITAGLADVARTEDVALRGDTADLLSRIHHPAAKEALRKLLDDPDPDVAEIAAEALEEEN